MQWFSTRAFEQGAVFYPEMDGPHNVNTFAIGFGPLLFFNVLQWGVKINTGFKKEYGSKIWPLKFSGGLTMPQIELNEDEVNGIASLLPLLEEDV